MLLQGRALRLLIFLLLCLPHELYSLTSANQLDAYNITFIFELIKNLNVRHRFDSLVSFSAERRLPKTATNGQIIRSLDRSLSEDVKVPIIIWGLQSNVSLRNNLISNTLVYAAINHFSSDNEPMLDTIHKTLDGRHDVRVLFILRHIRDSPVEKNRLIEFFTWCWQRNFINVAVTLQWSSIINGNLVMYNELFTYTPFPKVIAINVTSLNVYFPWFVVDLNNVHGYVFHLPVFQNIPNTYLVSLTSTHKIGKDAKIN